MLSKNVCVIKDTSIQELKTIANEENESDTD